MSLARTHKVNFILFGTAAVFIFCLLGLAALMGLNNLKTTDDRVTMLFVGDVMLGRNITTLINNKGLDYILGGLMANNFFDGYDLIGANLEGAVTDGGRHYDPVMDFDFAFRPEAVADLKTYGFNFFNLANNHFDDQDEQGMEETRRNLSNVSINFSGCKNGVVSDCTATIVTLKNKRIGMVGLSMVEVQLDLEQVKQMIQTLKDQTDWIVVNIHWGDEYDVHLNAIQQEVARRLIDSGVDAIVGHHPHVVQRVEVYRGKPIFYSLGNFIFDQYFSDKTQTGLAVSLEFSDETHFMLHPLRMDAGHIILLSDSETQDFINRTMKE